MKRYFCFLLLTLHSLAAQSQKDIRLVSGLPFLFTNRFATAKPTIFKIRASSRSLDTVSLISHRDSMNTTLIRLVSRLNYLVVHQENPAHVGQQFLTITNLKTVKSIEYNVDNAEFLIRMALVTAINHDSIQFIVNLHPNGYFTYSDKVEGVKVDEAKINKIFIDGHQGIAIHDQNAGLPLIETRNDSLFLHVRMYTGRQIYVGQFPSDIKFPKGTYRYYYTLAASTENLDAIICYNSLPDKSMIGKIGYMIRVARGDWYYKEFKGAGSGISAFGNWLAGYVADYNEGIYYEVKGQPIKYNFNRILPGKNERRPLFRSSEEEEQFQGESENFDQRAASIGYYYPGTLFIFNVSTKEYIEWETGQADSEILLIHKNRVWFRNDDRVFSAQISDSRLINITELVKDDRVRDVHWAYISKAD
jgi:hypothetical protein